ncbi:MAG: RNA polymerase sigma factor [Burkholderiales bacterium]|nr:RNA polymerase sigma factor [Bacteroidia bacterium]
MTAIEFNTRILNEKQSLKNFALSLTRNKEDALDLTQDTYVKAITYREKFEDSTNLKAWLFTIMKNTFINSYRRAVKTRQIIQTNADMAMARAFKNNYQDITESRLAAKDILKKIENLEDQYKIPFTRYYTGYRYDEIAQEMQLPLGTIKSRIFLARKQLMLAINR